MISKADAPARASLFGKPGSWAAVDDDFDNLWPAASELEGWLCEEQARALYRAARIVPAGSSIVEIGSHRGRSTVFLASAKHELVPLLAVDPFDDPRWGGGAESLENFRATLERFGLSDAVALFRGLSHDAAAAWHGEPVGLLFVDGAHDRKSVIADIDGWEGWVSTGGLVFFHDAFSSVGVTMALTERHLWNRQFRYVGSARSLVAFEQVDSGPASRVASTARVCAHYPYFLRNGLIKLGVRRGWRRVPLLLRYREGDDLY